MADENQSRATPAEAYSGHEDPTRVRVVLLTVAMTLFLASTGQSIVATALPEIVSDLGGLAYIAWVVTAFLLASTIGAPIAGKLGDMYGRKIVLQCGIGIFLLGGTVAGLAWNMPILILGRAVQGLGGGALIVVSMAVVADLLPPRERAKAQGMLSGVFGVSTVLGPLVGGFLVQSVGWHWIFFVNVPFGIAAFVVLSRNLEAPAEQKPHKMDYLGAVLLMVLLSSIVLVANLAGTVLAWTSVPVIGLLVAVLAALVGFVATERRAAEPVLPMPLFGIRNFQVANSVNFLIGMAMFGTISFAPMFLQVVKEVPPVDSGLYMICMMAGLISMSFTAGRVMTATGRYKFLPVGSTLVLALAMFGMAQLGPDSPMWRIALNLFFVGLGIGPTLSVGIVAIQTAVPREHLGVGTASANMFRLIGGSVGTSVFGAVFNHGVADKVAPLLPELGDNARSITTRMIEALPPERQGEVLQAFSDAMSPLFLLAMVAAGAAFLVATRLVELPLPGAAPARTAPTPAE